MQFDRVDLQRQLQALGRPLVLAFAAACAQRLAAMHRAFYQSLGESPFTVDQSLAWIWTTLSQNVEMDPAKVTQASEACLLEMPAEGPAGVALRAQAEEAAAAAAYALRFARSHDVRNAVYAAECGYNAATNYAMTIALEKEGNPSWRVFVESDIVQDELRRQARDLEDLAGVVDDRAIWAALFTRMHDRAIEEADTLLVERRGSD